MIMIQLKHCQGQLLGGQHVAARILHDPLRGGSAKAGPALSPLVSHFLEEGLEGASLL